MRPWAPYLEVAQQIEACDAVGYDPAVMKLRPYQDGDVRVGIARRNMSPGSRPTLSDFTRTATESSKPLPFGINTSFPFNGGEWRVTRVSHDGLNGWRFEVVPLVRCGTETMASGRHS